MVAGNKGKSGSNRKNKHLIFSSQKFVLYPILKEPKDFN
jgi:hypothetical protein